MDVLTIDNLLIETLIGVLPHERERKQTIKLTIDLPCAANKAAQHDNLRGTLDYQAVVNAVIAFIAQSQFNLIETLAEKTAELILTKFKTQWVKLTLTKPEAIAQAEAITLTIRRPAP